MFSETNTLDSGKYAGICTISCARRMLTDMDFPDMKPVWSRWIILRITKLSSYPFFLSYDILSTACTKHKGTYCFGRGLCQFNCGKGIYCRSNLVLKVESVFLVVNFQTCRKTFKLVFYWICTLLWNFLWKYIIIPRYTLFFCINYVGI